MKVAGFFSGIGGIELGFEQAGFEIVYSNEIDNKAIETFKANHSNKIVVDDIKNINEKDIPDVDVIVGGFPCQAFSIAGYRKGFEDERGEIFFQLVKIIRKKMPRVIFMENVKNLLTHDKGNTYIVIKKVLEEMGYFLKVKILNASELGNKIKKHRKKLKITQQTLANMFKVNIEVIKTIEDTYWNDSLYYHLSLMEKIEYYLLEIIKDNEKE